MLIKGATAHEKLKFYWDFTWLEIHSKMLKSDHQMIFRQVLMIKKIRNENNM